MIIKDIGTIRPHRYADKEFRALMGGAIGKATQDDLLAAFIYVQEARYAGRILDILDEHREDLDAQLTYARTRSTAPLEDTPKAIAEACRIAAQRVRAELQAEFSEAEQALREAETTFNALKETFSFSVLARHRKLADSPEPSEFEILGTLYSQYLSARDRLKTPFQADRQELHRIATMDAHRMAFVRSEASVTIAHIHAMHHSEFEQLAADLVRRDGYTVTRSGGGSGDLGADVIAQGPKGETVVIQCKHRAHGNGSIGSPDLQRLNGTARPVHGADIVIAMTNACFSLPAVRFAESQNIHLIEANELERWATWGQPMGEIISDQRAVPGADCKVAAV